MSRFLLIYILIILFSLTLTAHLYGYSQKVLVFKKYNSINLASYSVLSEKTYIWDFDGSFKSTISTKHDTKEIKIPNVEIKSDFLGTNIFIKTSSILEIDFGVFKHHLIKPSSLTVKIDSPADNEVIKDKVNNIEIKGSIKCQSIINNLNYYILDYKELDSGYWNKIVTNNSSIDKDKLGNWSIENIKDNFYTIRLIAYDYLGKEYISTKNIIIDRYPVEIFNLNIENQRFSPNSDGYKDEMILSFYINKDSYLSISIKKENKLINSIFNNKFESTGTVNITVNGKDKNNNISEDGAYTLSLEAKDKYDRSTTKNISFYIDNSPPETKFLNATKYFSPNNDGRHDTCSIEFLLNESATGNIYIAREGHNIIYFNKDSLLNPGNYKYTWDGRNSINQITEGEYKLTIELEDELKNKSRYEETINLDITAPIVKINPFSTIFSPNNDGLLDTAVFNIKTNENISGNIYILNSENKKLALFNFTSSKNEDSFLWDGLTKNISAPDGAYYLNVLLYDLAGNLCNLNSEKFTLDNTPPKINELKITSDSNYNFSETTGNLITSINPNETCNGKIKIIDNNTNQLLKILDNLNLIKNSTNKVFWDGKDLNGKLIANQTYIKIILELTDKAFNKSILSYAELIKLISSYIPKEKGYILESKDKKFSFYLQNNSLHSEEILSLEAFEPYVDHPQGLSFISKIYSIKPQIDLIKPAKVIFKADEPLKENTSIYLYKQNKGWTKLNTLINYEKNIISSYSSSTGHFALLADITPPLIDLDYIKESIIIKFTGSVNDEFLNYFTLSYKKSGSEDNFTELIKGTKSFTNKEIITLNSSFFKNGPYIFELKAVDDSNNISKKSILIDITNPPVLMDIPEEAPTENSTNQDKPGPPATDESPSNNTETSEPLTKNETPSADIDNNSNIPTVDISPTQNTVSYNIIQDTTPPEILVFSPKTNDILSKIVRIEGFIKDNNLLSYKIEFKAVSPSSNWQLIYREDAPNSEIRYDWPIYGLRGLYNIKISAIDKSNNTSDLIIPVNLDNLLPEINISSPNEREIVSENINISFLIEDDNPKEYKIKLGKGIEPPYYTELIKSSIITKNISFLLSLDHLIEDKLYTIFIEAVDLAENKNSIKKVIIKDTKSPLADIISPGDNEFISKKLNISGTSSDSDLETYNFKKYSIMIGEGFNATDFKTIYESNLPVINSYLLKDWETGILNDGKYTLKLISYDLFRKTEDIKNIIIDNTPPLINISQPQEQEKISNNISLKASITEENTASLRISIYPYNDKNNKTEIYKASTKPLNEVITDLDTRKFNDGSYMLEFEIEDKAKNKTIINRNIYINNDLSFSLNQKNNYTFSPNIEPLNLSYFISKNKDLNIQILKKPGQEKFYITAKPSGIEMPPQEFSYILSAHGINHPPQDINYSANISWNHWHLFRMRDPVYIIYRFKKLPYWHVVNLAHNLKRIGYINTADFSQNNIYLSHKQKIFFENNYYLFNVHKNQGLNDVLFDGNLIGTLPSKLGNIELDEGYYSFNYGINPIYFTPNPGIFLTNTYLNYEFKSKNPGSELLSGIKTVYYGLSNKINIDFDPHIVSIPKQNIIKSWFSDQKITPPAVWDDYEDSKYVESVFTDENFDENTGKFTGVLDLKNNKTEAWLLSTSQVSNYVKADEDEKHFPINITIPKDPYSTFITDSYYTIDKTSGVNVDLFFNDTKTNKTYNPNTVITAKTNYKKSWDGPALKSGYFNYPLNTLNHSFQLNLNSLFSYQPPKYVSINKWDISLVNEGNEQVNDLELSSIDDYGNFTISLHPKLYIKNLYSSYLVKGGDNNLTWDGKDENNNFVPEGKYLMVITCDGNSLAEKEIEVSYPPVFNKFYQNNEFISPNNDGLKDDLEINLEISEASTVLVSIYDSHNNMIASQIYKNPLVNLTYKWNGKDNSENTAPDGKYKIEITAVDSNGHQTIKTVYVTIDNNSNNIKNKDNIIVPSNGLINDYPSISSDGSKLLFSRGIDNDFDIFEKDLINDKTIKIYDSDAINIEPCYSPDNTEVIFSSNNKNLFNIMRTNITGDELKKLTFSSNNRNPNYSKDSSTIIFSKDIDQNNINKWNIWRMDRDGTNPIQITKDSNSNIYMKPKLSLDKEKIIYQSDENESMDIFMINYDGTNKTNITNSPLNEKDPNFSPDGTRIIYIKENEGLFQRDIDNITEEKKISDDCLANACFDLTGTRIYYRDIYNNISQKNISLANMNAVLTLPKKDEIVHDIVMFAGSAEDENLEKYLLKIFDGFGNNKTLKESFSPVSHGIIYEWNSLEVKDGDYTIEFSIFDKAGNTKSITQNITIDNDNWILTINNLQKITSGHSWNVNPSWSPDLSKIAFASNRNGNYDIYIHNFLENKIYQITSGNYDDAYPSWSPDGAKIAFVSDRSGNQDIWVYDFNNPDNLTQITNELSIDTQPSWSPSSNEIIFSSDRSNNFDLWIYNIDNNTLRKLTNSSYDETEPNWNKNGIVFTSINDDKKDIYVTDKEGSLFKKLTESGKENKEPNMSDPILLSDNSYRNLISFTSNRNGNSDIWVMDTIGTDNAKPLTTFKGSDINPAWSSDGSKIAFSSFQDGYYHIWVMDFKINTTILSIKNQTNNEAIENIKPLLISPINNEVQKTNKPTFKWKNPSTNSQAVYKLLLKKGYIISNNDIINNPDYEIEIPYSRYIKTSDNDSDFISFTLSKDESIGEGPWSWQIGIKSNPNEYYYSNIGSFVLEPPLLIENAINYPNPFNSKTTIRFKLSKAASVTIKIFDLSGHLVKELYSTGEVPKAEKEYNEVSWDGTNNNGQKVLNGIYFYKIEAVSAANEEVKTTGKMIYIK